MQNALRPIHAVLSCRECGALPQLSISEEPQSIQGICYMAYCPHTHLGPDMKKVPDHKSGRHFKSKGMAMMWNDNQKNYVAWKAGGSKNYYTISWRLNA